MRSIWQKLKNDNDEESVHLSTWPEFSYEENHSDIERHIEEVIFIVSHVKS